jgi:hypothetical protein
MIEHPEDYSDSGPSEPCGDLTGAPVGAGEAHRPPSLPPGMLAPMGVYNADWQRQAMEAAKTFTPPPLGLTWPPGRRCCQFTRRPPGGWSDCGPDGEG